MTNELIANPTTLLWEEEINRMLEGERDQQLEVIGNAAEYIENLIVESPVRALARVTFHQALDNIFGSWYPARPKGSPEEDGRYLRYLLDLAIAYTPFNAFGKIIELFKIPQKLDLKFPDDPGIDLRLKAFHALQRYFPAPPIGLSPVEEERQYTTKAFERYLDILWSYVNSPQYASYVARIFMELKVLSVGDSSMREVIKEQPRVLTGILTFLLESGRELDVERDVSALYELCLQLQAEGAPNIDMDFRSQLSQLNGELIDTNDSTMIIIKDAIGREERSIKLLYRNVNAFAQYWQIKDRETLAHADTIIQKAIPPSEGQPVWH